MKTILTLILLSQALISCTAIKPKAVEKKQDFVSIRTTSYTHGEKDHLKYGRKTAISSKLKDGVIASDWSVFPVGTVLKIDDKQYRVEDFGSALVKPLNVIPTIDIYQPSKRSMKNWGVKYFASAEVVEWGSFEYSAKLLKDRLRYKHCRVMYQRIQKKL